MPVGAIIGAVGSVGSALLGSSAAGKAADAQAAAANHAADLQMQQYQQSRADATPWRNAGGQAITQAFNMTQPGFDYTKSPGYDFRFNEGQRAIDSSGAAKGMEMSGGTLKDLMKYGQGFAAQDYNDQFNRLSGIAQGGQQVNANLAGIGQQAASGAGNALIGAGQARASGYIGQANAINGGLGNLAYLAQTGAFGGGNLFGGGGNFNAGSAISSGNSVVNSMVPMTPFSGSEWSDY